MIGNQDFRSRDSRLGSRLFVAFVLALTLSTVFAQSPAYDAGEPAPAQPGQQVLNVKDADITSFISLVSEATGKNFVVDPRVTGKVTVISQSPLGEDELYEVFLSVLRVNGFAAVPAGKIVKIVPEQAAGQDGGIDSGNSDALVTRIIPLKHVTPADMSQALRPLLPQGANLIPHPSSSSLIITDRAGNVARIESILRRLDQASESEIDVVPLSHATAAEVVRTLTLLQPANDAAGNKIAADERTNSVLIAGDKGRRLRWRALVTNLDTPLGEGDSTQVVYLRYADAEEMVGILDVSLQSLLGQDAVAGAKERGATSFIRAHKETNSLVITAPPAITRELRNVIRQLDIRRAQVMIEAVVAEVNDQTARELGIQWQATDDEFSDRGFIGGTNFPGSTGNGGIFGIAQNPAALATAGGLNLGYILGSAQLPGSDTEFVRIGALVKALTGDSATNILSTPSTVTLDHQEAILSVGQEVPFLTGQYAATGASQVNQGSNGQAGVVNPFQTIDRKEVGLKLKVTPHVNEGDSVVMDIDLEASSLAPNSSGAVDLITNTRKLTTRVLVPDGGMLVLGGLTSEELRESVQKVPGLGSIPLLGNLFKSRSTTKERRNLLVFLKPTIARDGITEAAISSEKYNFIRSQQLRAREDNDSLLGPEHVPVLPEYEDFMKRGVPAQAPKER
ncbi:MAG: type II secretion system secretin GspD [Xanthomonadales bacterium]|nr:Type II secretion system protein D [Xanthomonadales bacterium]MCC6591680.1 type II secretion system secretin GspD [Xanthomonadales bacterium]MCE7932862.1 type II secretion system protein GspD [Xanthomonadales bacterium PRO6]